MSKSALALITALGAVAALVLLVLGPADAQASPSAYAAWTVTPAPPTSTGTLVVPGTAVPDATFTTNSGGPSVPSGASTYLGSATPFGAEFGSSQNQPYLSLGTTGFDPSTTTFTFPSPTPASGWGFAFGDIDADTVRIEAFAPGGAALPASALGFRSVFNYCDNTPTPCTGGPHSDVPTWDPATGSLVGNGGDTSGAAGWFMPTAPIGSLRLTFSRISGSPAMQMWVAGHLSPPPTTTTTSTTSTTTSTTVVPTTSTVPPTTVAPPTTTPPQPPGPPTTPAHPAAPPARQLPDTGAGDTTLPLLAAGLALLSLGLAAAHFAQRRRWAVTRRARPRTHLR